MRLSSLSFNRCFLCPALSIASSTLSSYRMGFVDTTARSQTTPALHPQDGVGKGGAALDSELQSVEAELIGDSATVDLSHGQCVCPCVHRPGVEPWPVFRWKRDTASTNSCLLRMLHSHWCVDEVADASSYLLPPSLSLSVQAGRILLRAAIVKQLQVSNSTLHLERTAAGKPCLVCGFCVIGAMVVTVVHHSNRATQEGLDSSTSISLIRCVLCALHGTLLHVM